jgi:hypothetical protein
MAGPGVVLAPHLYPPSITRNPPEELETNKCRWDRSWGLKMQGLDKTSQVIQQAPRQLLAVCGRNTLPASVEEHLATHSENVL